MRLQWPFGQSNVQINQQRQQGFGSALIFVLQFLTFACG